MLYIPMVVMFCVTLTALVEAVYAIVVKLSMGQFVFTVDGLQLIIALALMILAISVAVHCAKDNSKAELNN